MAARATVAEEDVRRALEAALRAPSAHNAQPWRLAPLGGNRFRLWYALADKLLADPDDRDGLMAMGGFYETLRLSAHGAGLDTEFEWRYATNAAGIDVGTVSFAPLEGEPDALAGAVERRQCNRNHYSATALPPRLAEDLRELGHVMVSPAAVAGLVARASVMAWKDDRFIRDLRQWTRFDDVSPDGMTVDCLKLSATDQLALRAALTRRRLPAPIARLFAERDVRMTRASGAMAVLVAPDRQPETLFNCGRRLIRAWTLINAVGYAWHPMSIVIDQPTVSELSAMIDGQDPVAIYRVGFTDKPAAWSHRRPLTAVLQAPA